MKALYAGQIILPSNPKYDAFSMAAMKEFEGILLNALEGARSLPPRWSIEKLRRVRDAWKEQKFEIVRKKGVIPDDLQAFSDRSEKTTKLSLLSGRQAPFHFGEEAIRLYLHELAVLAGIENDGVYTESAELSDLVLSLDLAPRFKELDQKYVNQICQPSKDNVLGGITKLTQKDGDFAKLVKDNKVTVEWGNGRGYKDRGSWSMPNCSVEVTMFSRDFDFEDIAQRIPNELVTGFPTRDEKACKSEVARRISEVQAAGFVNGTALIGFRDNDTVRYVPGIFGKWSSCSIDANALVAISKERR